MNFGFIKVAAAVPAVEVADCAFNAAHISDLIRRAAEQQVQLMCFPELCITGYTCGDLFQQKILLDEAEEALSSLLRDTAESDILVIIGMPVRVINQMFNTAVIIQKGSILGIVPKSYIPNYGEFYEKRWFAPGYSASSGSISLCGQWAPFGTHLLFQSDDVCLGAEICEDLWGPVPPSSQYAKAGANIIFNLSASNEVIGKNSYLQSLIRQQSARCISGYVYASCGFGESTTDVVFAGNGYIAENGTMLASSQRFSRQEQLMVGEIDIERLMSDRTKNGCFAETGPEDCPDSFRIIPFRMAESDITSLSRTVCPRPFVPTGPELSERCEEIFSIQVSGLSKRLLHTQTDKIVVGISGGLDSTLALLSAVMTFDSLGLPRTLITGITMPGFGTSGRTYANAHALMGSLGVSIREIPIDEACMKHFADIGHDPAQHDTTYENVQARERTQILMDLANKEHALVLGTGDLSELALGWATYNGDHMSMYGINSGIPKTLVRHLVGWYKDHKANETDKKTLIDILDTPVSPELLPTLGNGDISQRTEDLVGPYELHDFFLYYTVRFGFRPSKIFFLAKTAFAGDYPAEVLKKWMQVFFKRFFAQQFKRSCLPDGPKVGSICLSPRGDWRMPSDASSRLWLEEIEGLL